MVELALILLQVDPETTGTIVKEVVQYGVVGIAALVFGWLYFKSNKRNSEIIEKEVSRLVSEKDRDKENSDSQINMLWTELQTSKNEEVEKYNILTQSLNETQLQTVKALQENAEVVKANTDVMRKNMEVMDKFINVLITNISK